MVNHDNGARIAKLESRIRALELSSPHNNASVSRGAFQILSSEGLIVQGSARVNGVERITGEWYLDGVGWVTGTLNISGLFKVTGDSTFSGDTVFSGSLDVTGPSKFAGTVDVTGNIKIIGNAIFDGDVAITKKLDVTAETLLRGKTTVTNDLEVASGGKFKAGPIEMDPASHNGSIRWGSGQEILSQSGALEFYSAGGITYGIQLAPDGVKIPLLPQAESAAQVENFHWLAVEPIGGKVWRVPNNIGSPLGGDLEWPWDPELNTDEFGPRVSPGGIGSTNHRGMDFGIGYTEGTNIRVCGRGTVIETGTGSVGGSGFGNFVVVQHPKNQRTLYGHMQSAPTWSVGDVIPKGGFVGKVGNTGSSTGAHLHLETHVIVGGAYEPVNPRTVITKPYAP